MKKTSMEGRKPFAQVTPRIYENCLIDALPLALCA
jgi:hypothetical protein